MMDQIAFLEQIALLYFSTSLLFFLVFYILFTEHNRQYILVWTVFWGIIAFNYAVLYLGLHFDQTMLLRVYALFIILSGFVFHRGAYSFLGIKSGKKWTPIYLGVFAVALVLLSLPVFSSFHDAIIFGTPGIFFLLSAISFIQTKDSNIKAVGMIIAGLALSNLIYPFVYEMAWFIAGGYIIVATFAFATALGTIGLHLDRLRNEHKALEDELLYLSYHDSLTGLKNRTFLEKYIEDMESNFLPACVIMADMNGLKRMNDTYGHRYGDEMIKAAATHIDQTINNRGITVRFGGDEFVAILPNTSIEDGLIICEQIASLCRETIIKEEELSISIGASVMTEDKEGFYEALHRAEKEMYKVKRKTQYFEHTI